MVAGTSSPDIMNLYFKTTRNKSNTKVAKFIVCGRCVSYGWSRLDPARLVYASFIYWKAQPMSLTRLSPSQGRSRCPGIHTVLPVMLRTNRAPHPKIHVNVRKEVMNHFDCKCWKHVQHFGCVVQERRPSKKNKTTRKGTQAN